MATRTGGLEAPAAGAHDEVLGADQHTARAVPAAQDGDEQVGAVVHGLAPLAHHVVQPQVQLVHGQVLLRLRGRLPAGVLQKSRVSTGNVGSASHGPAPGPARTWSGASAPPRPRPRWGPAEVQGSAQGTWGLRLMAQPQVQHVHGQVLLRLCSRLPAGVLQKTRGQHRGPRACVLWSSPRSSPYMVRCFCASAAAFPLGPCSPAIQILASGGTAA